MSRVVASIEARMGSSRLPGKVLMDVCGAPALTRLLDRLKQSRRLDGIILATSTATQDDVLADWAEGVGIDCFRGSEEDVLGRVVGAHDQAGSDVIVEVCGDMILLDPALIDHSIEVFLSGDCDVVSTAARETYPEGVDTQVFRTADLRWVSENIDDVEVREHVSLYFYQHPEKYRVIHLEAPAEVRFPELRFVLDYPGDLVFIRAVYERLLPEYGTGFTTSDIIRLLRDEPELAAMNRAILEAMKP